MKNTSPKITLIIISIVLAVVIAVGVFIFNEKHSVYYALGSFFISIISSFILLYFVNAIVVSKIKTISDTVKAFRAKNDDKQIVKVANSLNEVTALNNEIMAWAEDRKNEIERLKKLEVYRKEFLGNVSHELKTPIFNIQGYVLTLLDGGLEDETINRDYLQRAERSIDRMITIIDDLEAISQLETGELQIEPERFDIVALAKDVVEAQELKAKGKGILLNVQNDDKSIFVYADRFRIRQVIVNLIVNSVKYGKQNGETKIRIYDMGENVSIEVADNGLGIAAEHLPRLFERFYRVDKSRSREQGGTGLGLAIVKHIIEAHNQTINVMSTVGAGTVFSFTLKKG
ncbi:MAG: ATP-binding protein [Bacteroidia bacterium]|nr:ATP-binding protein [Bacteroidia bacterium]